MQQAIETAKQVLASAITFINNQKQTIASQRQIISELEAELGRVSGELTDFQAAEVAEDAEQEALMAQFGEALAGLGSALQE